MYIVSGVLAELCLFENFGESLFATDFSFCLHPIKLNLYLSDKVESLCGPGCRVAHIVSRLEVHVVLRVQSTKY